MEEEEVEGEPRRERGAVETGRSTSSAMGRRIAMEERGDMTIETLTTTEAGAGTIETQNATAIRTTETAAAATITTTKTTEIGAAPAAMEGTTTDGTPGGGATGPAPRGRGFQNSVEARRTREVVTATAEGGGAGGREPRPMGEEGNGVLRGAHQGTDGGRTTTMESSVVVVAAAL